MQRVATPEVYGNFAGSDVNGYSVAARGLARRVAGVTIDPNPASLDSRGLPRKMLIGSFDLLVPWKARPLVDRVMCSQEVKFLYDVGAYPYPGPHNIGSFCESEETPNFPLIPDAAKRIEIAKLQRQAEQEQLEANLTPDDKPKERLAHRIEATIARVTALCLSENLLPLEDIVDQVIDREMPSLKVASSKAA